MLSVAIVGTIADREVDEAGDAVFGRDSESNTLGSFGRLVFRAALKVGDYMQSVTAEARTKRAAGAEILNRQVP